MPLVLLVGGARSGKSRLAQLLALRTGAPVTVIATGEARDGEMEQRIGRHRLERPAGWRTVEEPVDLVGALSTVEPGRCAVVDCLTLWVSNLLDSGTSPDEIITASVACARQAAERAEATIVVSNEVGFGIVPANELARTYRDVLGAVNAEFATAADQSFLVVAGRAVTLDPFDRILEAAGG